MDPNAALKRIREIVRRDRLDYDDVPELVETIEELDRWLSIGGFFPVAWHESAHRTLHPAVSDDPWQTPETALKGKEPF